MEALGKVLSAVLLAAGFAVLMVHGDRALHAAVPSDMPADAQFLASGFDLAHNEPQGDWIACNPSETQDSDFCRITDVKGTIVYQGEYLPLAAPRPLDSAQIRVARVNPDKLWVQGPAEGQPVPVIPLNDGRILVPVNDREALAARWSAEPEELERVSERDR